MRTEALKEEKQLGRGHLAKKGQCQVRVRPAASQRLYAFPTPVSPSEGSPEGSGRPCGLLNNIRQLETHPWMARKGIHSNKASLSRCGSLRMCLTCLLAEVEERATVGSLQRLGHKSATWLQRATRRDTEAQACRDSLQSQSLTALRS